MSILRALGDTVQRDPRAPRYSFIDDPYLTPTEPSDMRMFMASKASGKRSAQYVVKKYPQFFNVSPFNSWLDMAPLVEAFTPQEGAQSSEDTVEGLRERIDLRMPEQAYASYQTLSENDVDIPEVIILDLLDLLCVYNSQDPKQQMQEDVFYEKEAHFEEQKQVQRARTKTWQDVGLAEQLYKKLSNPPPRAHWSLIRGRAKYHQVDKAYALYMEMIEKKIPVDLGTFNAILDIAPYMPSKKLWKSVLGHMVDYDVTPNLFTFNCLLRLLFSVEAQKEEAGMHLYFEVMNEMKVLKIEPSLSSWLTLFSFCKSDELRHMILDHLMGQQFSMHEGNDLSFFRSMMAQSSRFMDIKFAHKLNKLLHTGQNIKMLGDSLNNFLYYSKYFQLMLVSEEFDVVMEHYNKLVPHTITLNVDLILDFFRVIDLNKNYDFLQLLWEDNKYKILKRPALIERLLFLLAKASKGGNIQGIAIVNFICNKYTAGDQKSRKIRIGGKCIGHMITVYCKAEKWTDAWKMFDIYFTNSRSLHGFPSEESLTILAKAAIDDNGFTRLMKILHVMDSVGYPEIKVVANIALDKMELTEHQIHELKLLV